MPRILRTFLHAVIIAAAVATPGAWLLPQQVNSTVWVIRLGAPALGLIIAWVLIKHGRSEERLHDHLHDVAGHYFERSGLSFCIELRAIEGIAWLLVYYQGRYAGGAAARILLSPNSRSTPNPFDKFHVEFICEGAAFGVVKVPLAIAQTAQGRKVNCEVCADVNYPSGKGKKLRNREGIPVTSTSRLRPFEMRPRSILKSGGWANDPPIACTILELPVRVATSLPAGAYKSQVTLVQPDLPTGGFPVISPDVKNDRPVPDTSHV